MNGEDLSLESAAHSYNDLNPKQALSANTKRTLEICKSRVTTIRQRPGEEFEYVEVATKPQLRAKEHQSLWKQFLCRLEGRLLSTAACSGSVLL